MKNSLKNLAYEYILGKIISCEYMPLSYLDAARISRELGISRTPVRDAIAQLENEELVVVTPRRGIMVADIPADEISNIAKARRLLEPYIVSVACEKADRDAMLSFRDRFSSLSGDKDQIKAEYDLNLYLTSLTGNEYITQTMERVYTSNLRVQTMKKMPLGDPAEIVGLIDCILKGDPEEASSAVIRLISAQGIY
ncbi:MAG: GntR family transcriptional regulator [Oscillospiraceae bacterium]|nr:GntR family transcriptional regulator [Oscillospiraceae bacterium]MBQ4239543.1 GntR family transcriptional regulator [Oscillospiraceae bacterium]MBQ5411825.1 GntR family transcriptional regulator [Oscillospiraceae bacterium]